MTQLPPIELLAQLQSYISSPPSLSDKPILKSQLYQASQALLRSLESPPDPISRVAVSQQAEWIALRIGCEMGLFPALGCSNSARGLAQLATATTAEPALLLRIVRAGVAFGSILQVGVDAYTLAPAYAQLGQKDAAWALPKFGDFVHGIFEATPGLLRDTGWVNPADPDDTAVQRAWNAPGKKTYEIFASRPDTVKAIGMLLATMGTRPSQRVQNTYPVQKRLVEGFDKDVSEVMLVDVGAGHSHALDGLREAMPGIPGRFIAQDLPYMIKNAPQVEGIEWQAYDFFTEQPVKHARAYYIRLCLHNWCDSDCLRIISQFHAAMKPAYSRLIIHEQVISERDPHIWAVTSDLNQMGTSASKERTEQEWKTLVAQVPGLRVSDFYRNADPASEVAIEVLRHV